MIASVNQRHVLPRHVVDRALEPGPREIASEAALAFARDGYPGVDEADPDDFQAVANEETYAKAEAAVAEAGYNPDDPEISDAIFTALQTPRGVEAEATWVAYTGDGNSDQWAAYDVFHALAPSVSHRRPLRSTLPPRRHGGGTVRG
jgi:hypothetical protein